MEPTPEKVHDVDLLIGGWFSVNDNAVYVYDSTETRSGLVFNFEDAAFKPLTNLEASNK